MTALIALVGSSSVASAQDWGDIPKEHWQALPPEDSPNTAAVLLFDHGYAQVEVDGVEFKRHLRMKLFEDYDTSLIQDIALERYHYDKLFDVKAHILRPDGSAVEYDKDDFKTAEIGAKRLTKFSFPEARAGDIVELSYGIDVYGGYDKLGPEKYFLFSQERPYQQFAGRKWAATRSWDESMNKHLADIPDWYFDHSLFCQSSRFVVRLGGDLDYSYYSTNLPLEVAQPAMERIKVFIGTAYKEYTWQVDNVGPFVYDSTSELGTDAQRSGLHFRLFSNINGENRMIRARYSDEHFLYVGRSIQGYIDEYIKKPRSLKKTVANLTGDLPDDLAKIDAIVRYLSDNFKFDSTGFEMRPRHENMRKLIDKKIGMPFEINLLMLEMLHIAGIEAFPVLISTRDRISFRYSGTFNHLLVMAMVNGDEMLLDVASSQCALGTLIKECVVKEGVVVNYDESEPRYLGAKLCDADQK